MCEYRLYRCCCFVFSSKLNITVQQQNIKMMNNTHIHNEKLDKTIWIVRDKRQRLRRKTIFFFRYKFYDSTNMITTHTLTVSNNNNNNITTSCYPNIITIFMKRNVNENKTKQKKQRYRNVVLKQTNRQTNENSFLHIGSFFFFWMYNIKKNSTLSLLL